MRMTQLSEIVVVDELATVHLLDHVWVVECNHTVVLLHVADTKALRIERGPPIAMAMAATTPPVMIGLPRRCARYAYAIDLEQRRGRAAAAAMAATSTTASISAGRLLLVIFVTHRSDRRVCASSGPWKERRGSVCVMRMWPRVLVLSLGVMEQSSGHHDAWLAMWRMHQHEWRLVVHRMHRNIVRRSAHCAPLLRATAVFDERMSVRVAQEELSRQRLQR